MLDETSPSTDFSVVGLLGSDSVSCVSLTSPGTAGTATVAGSPYAITPSGASGPGLSNYVFSYVAGTLTVNPVGLTITAANRSKTYGATVVFDGTTPSTDFTVTGLFNSDTVDSVNLSSPGAAGAATVAGGPYPITASGATGTGLGNYTIGYVSGTLTVNRAGLTITAANRTKTYGATVVFDETLPSTDFSVTGLFNNDTVNSVSLTSTGAVATAGVAGSPYEVVPGGAAGVGLHNYTIAYVSGALTVNPATLTVTADNKSRIFGTSNPVLTASYTGFVAGETLATSGVTGSPDLSTTATAASPVGSYPITVQNGSLTAVNYNFSFVNGTLSVVAPAPTILSITVLDPSQVLIVWDAVSNVTYRVQARADFSSPWVDLSPDVTATSDTATGVDNPSGAAQRFYRLMVVP